jgi:hypothetical protein
MVLPPQRRARPPPYTGLVLGERPASWYHGVSPSQHQARLQSLLAALRNLAGRGLNAKFILAHLHHRRIVPLMERPLRIFEMTEEADPVALARSRTLPGPLLRDYAATRARRTIDPNSGRYNENALWDLEMLPTGPLVTGVLDLALILPVLRVVDHSNVSPAVGEREHREVRAAHPPLLRARARGAAARASGSQEGACDAAQGAPRTEERGVPVARAAGALLAGDRGVLIIGRGGGRGGRGQGAGPPR